MMSPVVFFGDRVRGGLRAGARTIITSENTDKTPRLVDVFRGHAKVRQQQQLPTTHANYMYRCHFNQLADSAKVRRFG